MWNFNKILGIKGIEIIDLKEDRDKFTFLIKSRRKYAICPNCKVKTKRLKSLSKLRTIKNGTILGKACVLKLRSKRFYCPYCKKTFTEELSNFKKRQKVTLNHKIEVISSLATQSFRLCAKKYKVSYHTQRRWLKELVDNQVFNFEIEEKEKTPFVLGIDEVSFAGHDMITTIGNISKHRLKGVMVSRRKDELKKILKSISPTVKPLIFEIVIDMCDLYKKAVEEALPNAQIVVDHFHVVSDANKRLDEERLILQDIYRKKIPKYILTKNKESLKEKEHQILISIFNNYPSLKMFYLTKERLRDMYKSSSKDEAEEKLRLIISSLTSTDDGELISWGNTLFRWKKEILAYFNSRSTNGFMEGMNNKIKLIKRISFGFKNKKVFIYKVMLSVLITSILLPHLMT